MQKQITQQLKLVPKKLAATELKKTATIESKSDVVEKNSEVEPQSIVAIDESVQNRPEHAAQTIPNQMLATDKYAQNEPKTEEVKEIAIEPVNQKEIAIQERDNSSLETPQVYEKRMSFLKHAVFFSL